MIIIKVYNLNRSTNRLVGYVKVNEKFDFDKQVVTKADIAVKEEVKFRKVPNEHFYRKVRKALGVRWLPHFAWKELSLTEVNEILASYRRKIDFYTKQQNLLNTISADLKQD